MLLTITTTYKPARDIGYLLHKNPDSVQSFPLSYGQAHVFYPEASDKRCTMALLLEVDPVGLVRNQKGGPDDSFGLKQYVNDRPYVGSSLLSVTLSRLFGTALGGRSSGRPELVKQAIPLEAKLAVVPCRGGERFLRLLFEPLGYRLKVQQHPLDEKFPEWGEGVYFTIDLEHTITLKELLSHLYVLVPVLDGEKHYWVGEEEIEKLLKKGAGWLETHPAKDVIAYRYLRRKGKLARSAIHRLLEEDVEEEGNAEGEAREPKEVIEEKVCLNEQRLKEVYEAIKKEGVNRVLDLGCGEGKLLQFFLKDRQFTEIIGLDVSHRSLERAMKRLRLERLPENDRERITLRHGSLMYRDPELTGYDAAAVVEVIEHLDPPRLAAFERVVFECATPGIVVITTPNAEYNVKYENLQGGKLRHSDHRFEWTRSQFKEWGGAVAERFGYSVEFRPVGPEDESVGSPTQMGVFKK
ncbi:MAG: 3' terminal RNA ribose 2'-O-methyltransferase Hen1 [bacterium]|nr:3' terminal RNA ribose 2'-O-methyltransferase Hen1 [bacterium]